jgi:micrococcal nuclease
MTDPQTRPTFNDRYVYAARCVQVIDGDTLDLDIDLGMYFRVTKRVRLKGIDTPELRGPMRELAKKAHDLVKFYTENVQLLIRTELDKDDKYGRLLVDIWVDNLNVSLSDHLVECGMARRYDGGTR